MLVDLGGNMKEVKNANRNTVIHKKMKGDRLKAFERTLVDILADAQDSSLRKKLEAEIKNIRELYYSMELGQVDFPFKNASNKNINTMQTQIGAYLDRLDNAVLSADPLLNLDLDGEGDLDVDEKVALEKMFDEEVKSGRLDLAKVINNYFENVLRDGITCSRVIRERIYECTEEERMLSEWQDDEEWDKLYKSQVLTKVRSEENEDKEDDNIIKELDPNSLFRLKISKTVDKPNLEVFAIDRILFPEDTEDYLKADWLGYRKWISLDTMRRLVKTDTYYDESVQKLWDYYEKQVVKDKRILPVSDQMGVADQAYVDNLTGRQSCEVVEIYIKYDINEDGFDELCLAEIAIPEGLGADGQVGYILRMVEWDKYYAPIVIDTFDQKNELLLTAKGLASWIYSLHKTVNKLFNDAMDASTLNNNQIIKFRLGRGYRPDDFINAPSAHWGVEDMNDVEPVFFPESKGSQFELQKLTNSYIQKQTGISDYTMASESNISQNDTWRGMSAIIQQGNIKIERKLRQLKPCLDKMFKMYFDILANRDDLRVIVNSNFLNVSKDLEIRVAQTVVQFMMGIPYVQQKPTAVWKLGKMIFDAFNKSGYEDIWPELEAQKEEHMLGLRKEQMMQGAMMQGQPQGQPQSQGPPRSANKQALMQQAMANMGGRR